MHACLKPFHCLAAGLCLATLGVSAGVQAAPLNLNFSGQGNVVVFDPLAATGGWVGTVTEFLDPSDPGPARSYVSVVTFSFDRLTGLLDGQFEFTVDTDLTSSFFGTVSGSFTDPASDLNIGGQLGLDYLVTGGTGDGQGSTGFGLSFLTYDLNAFTFNNYDEQGLLVLDVPNTVSAPATLALVLSALGLMGALRRRLAA